MSRIVEINGESLLELDETERRFMEMFVRCIDIKDSKYKLWLDEDIDLYSEFINGLKEGKANRNVRSRFKANNNRKCKKHI